MIDLITLLSTGLVGNLLLSQIVGGIISVRGRRFILSPKVKERVLEICVLYDTFVIVLLLAPL
jgi:2-keto-3-deoxy-6-phosphogluconate aldolase